MTLDEIFVLIGGILLIALVVWYFWLSSSEGTHVQSGAGGLQEALIKVKGGYSPNVVVVKAGKPVKLNFLREETAACSEQVVFPDFGKQATLTPHKTIPVEFTPEQPGEYEFQCAMGMLRGKLIVE
ncbi:cupredoxin domain-containing protein [Aliifodinibius sp. S!AR15-10]|uniref:cupredoxin domain-containing protein n=1 Tax=Aliifodinibius sp. S!AR15-10 TaxID=2950437 RepID=UPI00285C2A27|nr:cupredoxin domain-containing protein [Aliifodinibius sp. S!AR15-10]MDR8391452.1 cupredoxin domain-containing protein [Aliifodinibius sp. S!AR15-10]